jgi:hypothetical protein
VSIPVPVKELAAVVAEHDYAYLVTVSDDGRPHAVAVVPALTDGTLRAGVGHRSSVNIEARPDAVTLVWPPREVGGYTLIVDGTASVADETLSFVPSKAVMHRPAPADHGPVEAGACGSDCVPVSLP